MSDYSQQARGSDSAYERYLKGMDASMQQKVALTAAHLLGRGRLLDMGMGSGTGSEALAALYPNIQVTGVDINPEMVKRAAQRYQRDNLDFQVGDIAEECFPPESVDMIFDSSVLHHVTTFNGYEARQAERAIRHQVRQLKGGGNLIVRDFVRPGPGQVVLSLPPETSRILERFSQEFRKLLPEGERGFPYRELEPLESGWRRFQLEHSLAVEFILRKDYLTDWDTEILEEYTYFTQAEFEEVFRGQGLRILASTPIRNPWIVRNRFQNKFQIESVDGNPLMFPPTNYLIVGEKVAAGQGVRHVPGEAKAPLDYLHFAHYRDRRNGNLRDLVRRPNATLDVVPYYREDGEVYVLARRSYPRPLLTLCENRLDGCLSPSYVTEPIVVIQRDFPLAQTVESELKARIGLDPGKIRRFRLGSQSYPSPGGLQERVQAVFVEIEPAATFGNQERVRALAARQLLRAAQVGGLPDARLELHCVELLQTLSESTGSWIGETLTLGDKPTAPLGLEWDERPRRAFVEVEESANFLHLGSREFCELSADGEKTKSEQLDFVRPETLSLNTLATALLWRSQGVTYIGLQDDDFPAAQCFVGHSNLLVTPAWRLPKELRHLLDLEQFTAGVLREEHGIEVSQFFTLGGPYYPSPGTTPEVVYPLAIEVESVDREAANPLIWMPLKELKECFSDFADGHLRVLASRVVRALGKGVSPLDTNFES